MNWTCTDLSHGYLPRLVTYVGNDATTVAFGTLRRGEICFANLDRPDEAPRCLGQFGETSADSIYDLHWLASADAAAAPRMLVGTSHGRVLCVDATTGAILTKYIRYKHFNSAHASCDGALGVASGYDYGFRLFDIETGALTLFRDVHANTVNRVRFARHARTLFATGSNDGTVKLWDARVASSRPVRCMVIPGRSSVISLDFSPRDDFVMATCLEGEAMQFRMADGRLQSRFAALGSDGGNALASDAVMRAVYSASGKYVFSSSSGANAVHVLSADSGEHLSCIPLPLSPTDDDTTHIMSLRSDPHSDTALCVSTMRLSGMDARLLHVRSTGGSEMLRLSSSVLSRDMFTLRAQAHAAGGGAGGGAGLHAISGPPSSSSSSSPSSADSPFLADMRALATRPQQYVHVFLAAARCPRLLDPLLTLDAEQWRVLPLVLDYLYVGPEALNGDAVRLYALAAHFAALGETETETETEKTRLLAMDCWESGACGGDETLRLSTAHAGWRIDAGLTRALRDTLAALVSLCELLSLPEARACCDRLAPAPTNCRLESMHMHSARTAVLEDRYIVFVGGERSECRHHGSWMYPGRVMVYDTQRAEFSIVSTAGPRIPTQLLENFVVPMRKDGAGGDSRVVVLGGETVVSMRQVCARAHTNAAWDVDLGRAALLETLQTAPRRKRLWITDDDIEDPSRQRFVYDLDMLSGTWVARPLRVPSPATDDAAWIKRRCGSYAVVYPEDLTSMAAARGRAPLVLHFGGFDIVTETCVNDLHCLDCADQSWTGLGSITTGLAPSARYEHAAAVCVPPEAAVTGAQRFALMAVYGGHSSWSNRDGGGGNNNAVMHALHIRRRTDDDPDSPLVLRWYTVAFADTDVFGGRHFGNNGHSRFNHSMVYVPKENAFLITGGETGETLAADSWMVQLTFDAEADVVRGHGRRVTGGEQLTPATLQSVACVGDRVYICGGTRMLQSTTIDYEEEEADTATWGNKPLRGMLEPEMHVVEFGAVEEGEDADLKIVRSENVHLRVTRVPVAVEQQQQQQQQPPVTVHVESLCADLDNYLFSEAARQHADMTLRASSGEFRSFASLLRARCTLFDKAMSGDMVESRSGEIQITTSEDGDEAALLDWVHGLLSHTLELHDAPVLHMVAVLGLCERYGLLALQQRCEGALSRLVSADTVCEVLPFADWLHLDLLRYVCYRQLLQSANLIELLAADGFAPVMQVDLALVSPRGAAVDVDEYRQLPEESRAAFRAYIVQLREPPVVEADADADMDMGTTA